MHIPNIKTNLGLVEKLTVVAGTPMSQEEAHAQRISWIFGQTSGHIQRTQIAMQLGKQDGRA